MSANHRAKVEQAPPGPGQIHTQWVLDTYLNGTLVPRARKINSQHLLDNQLTIFNKIDQLDASGLAAQTAVTAKEVKRQAALVGSAAELSVQVPARA